MEWFNFNRQKTLSSSLKLNYHIQVLIFVLFIIYFSLLLYIQITVLQHSGNNLGCPVQALTAFSESSSSQRSALTTLFENFKDPKKQVTIASVFHRALLLISYFLYEGDFYYKAFKLFIPCLMFYFSLSFTLFGVQILVFNIIFLYLCAAFSLFINICFISQANLKILMTLCRWMKLVYFPVELL